MLATTARALALVLALAALAAPSASAISQEAYAVVERAPPAREAGDGGIAVARSCALGRDDCEERSRAWSAGVDRALDPIRGWFERMARGDVGDEAAREQAHAEERAERDSAAWQAWLDQRTTEIMKLIFG